MCKMYIIHSNILIVFRYVFIWILSVLIIEIVNNINYKKVTALFIGVLNAVITHK